MAYTVNRSVPTRCPVCGQPMRPRRQRYGWQRHCSTRCANLARWGARDRLKQCYGLADDAALAAWLVEQLNRRHVHVVAELCGITKPALYQWLREFGIRREVRWVQTVRKEARHAAGAVE